MADETLRDWTILYLKGVCMGAADALPGVSGGTIALIVGIYERLVSAVAAIDTGTVEPLIRLHRAEGRADFRRELLDADAVFLAVLGAGIGTAVITVLRIVSVAAEVYPAPTYAFFFGLIAASAIVLRGAITVDTPGRIGAGIGGFLLAIAVAGGIAAGSSHALPILFLSGMVAIPAMILPGISGSLVLVIIGQYAYMAGTLSEFLDALAALVTGGSIEMAIEPGTDVAAFMAGAVVGLLGVARAVEWALDRYRAATLTFLIALMIGGLRAPGGEVLANLPTTTATQMAVVGSGIAGAALVVVVDHYTDDIILDPDGSQ